MAIARASRSSSSRPSRRAASGSRSPTRSGRRRLPGASGSVAAVAPGVTAARSRRAVPSASVVTAHAVPTERSAGIDVLERGRGDERLRQRRDPADEVRPPLRVQLREHVVEQQQRRAAVERREQVELRELEGEDRGPLLAPRRERGERPAAHLEHEVVAVRPDQRRAVPDLLVGRLREASARARRGRTRRGAAARSSRTPSARRPSPPRRARSPRGPRRAGPARASSSRWRSSRTAVPASSRVASQKRSSARVACSSRIAPQQAVALLERPSVGGEVPARRPASAGRRARSRASRRSDGEPATSSISSGANITVRSTPASAAAPARDAVDADPLAGAAAGRPDEGDLDGVALLGRRPRPTDARLDPGQLLGPSGRARPRRSVRWERPQASRTIASSRLVLPAALGPHTSCGPASKTASSAA